MEAFTLTMFWLFVFCTAVGALNLLQEHPRSRKAANTGEDTLSFIINLAAMAWAAYLYWGK